MSLEDLADDPDASLADLINTQVEAGATIIHLGKLGKKLGLEDFEIQGRPKRLPNGRVYKDICSGDPFEKFELP